MVDDRELMARVRAGEHAALEALFSRWEAPIFEFFCRLGCPLWAVGDLTEEVLVLVYRRSDRYDASRPLSPWLFGIARLVWRDYRRRRGREVGRTVPVEDVEGFPGAADPAGVAEGHQAVEQLRRAVSDLPEEQQMTFLLRHFHGLSYEEVAQVLGIPLGTVKWRLHDTMQRLKRSLAAHRKEGRAW